MADIDTLTSLHFSASYPLPFRVLFLSFATLLGFATNLHILSFLGIDTALVLDIRLDDYRSAPSTGTGSPGGLMNGGVAGAGGAGVGALLGTAGATGGSSAATRAAAPFVHPTKLYPPLYTLAALGLAWTAFGWFVFSKVTKGVPEEMVKWRIIPALVAVVCGVATVAPWNVLHRKERFMFLRSLRQIILSPLYSPVPFSDIILADILTSSAKVLGDVWVSGCLLFTVTEKFGLGGESEPGAGCARVFMVPVMTSLPYLFRFRQCLSEVLTGSTPTPRKSILNALKYASAFPVIILSAMQTVLGDPFDEVEKEAARHAWISPATLFKLWIFAVLVNSLYSFWWDVTNDWGLSLLTRGGWSSSTTAAFGFPPTPLAAHYSRLPSSTSSPRTHANTQSNTHPHSRARSGLLNAPAGGSSSMSPSGSTGSNTGAGSDQGVSVNVTTSAGMVVGGGGGVIITAPSDRSDRNARVSFDFPPPPSRPHSPIVLAPPSVSPKPFHSHHPPHPISHSHSPRARPHSRAYSTASTPNISFPFLRPILLLPDPTIYYLAIALDLILRFTWSLKLSSHLHAMHEMESGIFLMEALEVIRRWMWVYLRIEWEAVRKGGGGLVEREREREEREEREATYRDALNREEGEGITMSVLDGMGKK